MIKLIFSQNPATMKKILAVFVFIICASHAFAQGGEIAIGIGKLLGLAKTHASVHPIPLNSATEILNGMGKGSYLKQGYSLVEKDAYGLLIKSGIYNELSDQNNPYRRYLDKKMYEMIKSNTSGDVYLHWPVPQPARYIAYNLMTDPDFSIRKIQGLLKILGYPQLKMDGVAGTATKIAINEFFGIDCSTLTDSEIKDQVFAYLHKNVPVKTESDGSNKLPVKAFFAIRVKKNNEPQTAYDQDNLSEKDLNIELAALKEKEHMRCGFGEICFNPNEKNATVSVECEDGAGNTIEISISTEGSIDLTLKSKSGKALKLTTDKEGKLAVIASKKIIIAGDPE